MDRCTFVNRAIELMRPLTNFARVEIRAHEALGDLPPGAMQPNEIVDAALIEAISRLDEAPDDRLYPWLRRFVRRAIRREVMRERPRRRERSLFSPVGIGRPDEEGSGRPRRLVDILPDPSSPIPDSVVEGLELQQLLATLLWQLPPTLREPFVLHVRDGLSPSEIARLEGLLVTEVRRRIDRARELLRMRLADEYGTPEALPPVESLFAVLRHVAPLPIRRDEPAGGWKPRLEFSFD